MRERVYETEYLYYDIINEEISIRRNINELDEGCRAAGGMVGRVTVCPERV
jgi:hypothetical protein